MTHQNPTQAGRTATAPYNFIPLPEKVIPAEVLPDHDSYDGKRFTGTITCRLDTKTPLYTRTMLTPEQHQAYAGDFHTFLVEHPAEAAAFFHHGDPSKEPVIPGSSLRGMLRTLVEILSYSKVDWVTGKKLVYRAVGDRSSLGIKYRSQLLGTQNQTPLPYPNRSVRGGYLRRRGSDWYIQPAQEHLGESIVHVNYTDANQVTHGSYGTHRTYDVYVQPAARVPDNRGQRGTADLILNIAITRFVQPRTGTRQPGWEEGVLIESGQMGKLPPQPGQHPKHMHCVIYAPNTTIPQDKWLKVPDDIWAAYQEDLKISREAKNTPRELKDGSPLFYLVDSHGDLVFFGPTMMFRLLYPHSPHDFIPAEIRDPSIIDMTDAIFGYVRDEDPGNDHPQHYAGRVRFSDARRVDVTTDPWHSEQLIKPQILSGPKPTTFQHYLEQSQPDDSGKLKHYADIPQNIKIRGHKLYWHRGNDFSSHLHVFNQPNLGTQDTLIKPVKTELTFEFKINFENLTAAELGALLWAIELPAGDNQERCHRLGMAKPLGLGSVKIRVESLQIQDRQHRYQNLFQKAEWDDGGPKEGQNTATYHEAFEAYVTGHLGVGGPYGAQPRIQMLLTMLRFPGPNLNAIRYMTIQPNQFKDRPVLPDPLRVFPAANAASPVTSHGPSSPQTPVQKQSPGEGLSIGSRVRFTIKAIEGNEYWGELAGCPENYIGILPKSATQEKPFKVEQMVRCTVVRIEENSADDEVNVYLERDST